MDKSNRFKQGKMSWKQGFYTPLHPEKYNGDINNITFMSSWEESFARFLDGNINVKEWASEEFCIPYFNPVKKRPADYYPDFWVKYINKHGEEIIEVIEIKPHKQVQRPKGSNRYEMEQWVQNMAKWEAAVKFCKERGVLFRVLTEKKLFK